MRPCSYQRSTTAKLILDKANADLVEFEQIVEPTWVLIEKRFGARLPE